MCGALRDGVQVFALLCLCLLLDWRLAVVSFVIYPVAFWPIARLGRRLRRAAGDALRERGSLVNTLHDQVGRLPAIQLTGEERNAEIQLGAAVGRFGSARVRVAAVRVFASPFTEVMGAVGLAVMLIYTGGRIDAGTLAAEHALSFFAALLMMYQPAKGLARLQGVIEPGRAALARLVDLNGRLEPAAKNEGFREPPSELPALRFENITVQRGGRQVLDRVSLDIAPGEWVAIQGPNGAGKSTLAWILGRLISPESGTVWVGEYRLEEFKVGRWRSSVGWVTQSPWLSRGSIRENVCSPEGLVSLESLAQRTGLSAVIERLPEGWETPLGDDGAGLSLGERQRVSLARALAREPCILVLDEPAAHLDVAGRARLLDTIESVRDGRSILMITHSDEVAGRADRVVRFQAPDEGAPLRGSS